MVAKAARLFGIGLAYIMTTAPASAADCLLGEIRMFAGNFAPIGYLPADGRLVSIAEQTALFSVLGTTYGGDGRTNFALPDLRGRVPIGAGQGPGLNAVPLGLGSGSEWTQPRAGQAAAGNGATVGLPVPISTMQPSTAINYMICVNGNYPSRQ